MRMVCSGSALAVILAWRALFAIGAGFCYSPQHNRCRGSDNGSATRLRRHRARSAVNWPPSAPRRSTTSSIASSSASTIFMAQMRHMHPLVETYLQDLKNEANGNAISGQRPVFSRPTGHELTDQRTFRL